MIERVATLIVSMRRRTSRLMTRPTSRPVSDRNPRRDEVGVAHLVGEAALLLDVAPDDEMQAGAKLDGDGDPEVRLCRAIGGVAEYAAGGARSRAAAG